MSVRGADGEEMLTVAQAAAELGLSASTLRVQVWKGQIKATSLTDRMNLISRSEVERYKAEHRGRQNNPLCRKKAESRTET